MTKSVSLMKELRLFLFIFVLQDFSWLGAGRTFDSGRVLKINKRQCFMSDPQADHIIRTLIVMGRNCPKQFDDLIHHVFTQSDLEGKTKEIAGKYGFLDWDGTLKPAVVRILHILYG